MSRLMIVVEFEVKPEHHGAFVELMKNHARLSRAEDGCQQFDVLLAERSEPRPSGRGVARPGSTRRAREIAADGAEPGNLPAVARRPQGDALYCRLARRGYKARGGPLSVNIRR